MNKKTAGPALPSTRHRQEHPRSVPIATLDPGSEPDHPFEEGAHDALGPDLRHRMISEAAFHLYAQHGYADGYDFDDWLTAEAEIDHLLLNPEIRRGPPGTD